MSEDFQNPNAQPSDSVFTRVKAFFGSLFASRSAPAPEPPGTVPCQASIVVSESVAPLGEGAHAHVPTAALPEVDLVIGLDLGTSFSKVVIGDYGVMGKSYPVVFCHEDSSIGRHLLPTVFCEGAVECQLHSNDGPKLHNLKLRLMQSLDDRSDDVQSAIENLAIYVALVLRHTILWFAADHGADYNGLLPCWHLNVGFPRKNVGGPLLDAYKQVASAAVIMASSNDAVNRGHARRALRQRDMPSLCNPLVHPARVHFYPEIAAQLAGYSKSPYRRNGNLMLVDVGAGTLDVSTLILHDQEHQDICSFHFCGMEPLGAFRLFAYRCEALQAKWPALALSSEPHLSGGFAKLPDTVKEHLQPGVTADDAIYRVFCKAGREFADKCRHACFSRLVQFRNSLRRAHHNPDFDPWPNKLPFILAGGGSRMDFYRDALYDPLEQRLAQNYSRHWHISPQGRAANGQGFEPVKFPVPAGFEIDPSLEGDFDRLSVAHGLAYGADDLMRITTSIQSDSDEAWTDTSSDIEQPAEIEPPEEQLARPSAADQSSIAIVIRPTNMAQAGLVKCPHCQQRVKVSKLDKHLKKAHPRMGRPSIGETLSVTWRAGLRRQCSSCGKLAPLIGGDLCRVCEEKKRKGTA